MAALSPNSSAIFCVGDNTDLGTQAEYDLLLKNIEEAGVELPPMYYAIGGHDVYTNAYDQEIERFLENLKMESVYYCVDIHGIRFIVLGSDSKVPEGELGKEQLNWLRERLAETDKSKPVFIFHHQPLKETVSGTLYSSDPEIQDWFGLLNSGDELREILSECHHVFRAYTLGV
jgi:purple acid phosphatase/fibronectin domain protein